MSADTYSFTVEGTDYTDVKARAAVIARAYWGMRIMYRMRIRADGDTFQSFGSDVRLLIEAEVTTVRAEG